MPNICLQMLLRGRNTVGYTPYPDDGDRRLRRARRPRTGIDIFRIFDALNDVDQMRPAIEAVRETGTAVAEVALCYTGDLLDPASGSTPSTTTCGWPSRSSSAGAHILAIKDMAGLLRAPAAARSWSPRCASGSTCRCTCTPTTPPAASSRPCSPRSRRASTPWTCASAADGRHDQPARCRRSSPPPRTPSAPPASTCARSATSSRTGRRSARLYAPFESGLPAPDRPGLRPRDPRRPALQPAPAGDRAGPGRPVRGRSRTMYAAAEPHPRPPRRRSRRRPRWSATSRCIWSAPASARDDFAGDPDNYDIPDSVIGFLRGELGDPPGGWPEPFRTKALAGRRPAKPACSA